MQLTRAFTIRLDRSTDAGEPARLGTGAGVGAAVAIESAPAGTVLVLGGPDNAGRRVAERLAARGLAVRVGSRVATPPFDWEDQATWAPALCGVDRVYLTYSPDLAIPGAAEICLFTGLAVALGVRRLVLLSEGGTEEARCAEEAVRGASAESTILRSSWIVQDFGERPPRSAELSGEVAPPGGEVGEPFAAKDDIADIVVVLLSENGHAGRFYELTDRAR